MKVKLLVFQHIDCEHPGSLRTFLNRDQVEWHAVNLHRNEAIPNLEGYDALWVMGGPMDVWDTDEFPWLIAEKKAIYSWVKDHGKPFLGLCLGHQLLADALGGLCSPQNPAEIGILPVSLTTAGVSDSLFRGVPHTQKFLQWHSVAVSRVPDNTVILASSELCPIQAMRVGSNAWSMQYHAELESDTIDNWGCVPAYEAALKAAMGKNGLSIMRDLAEQEMDNFLSTAENIYNNFMKAI